MRKMVQGYVAKLIIGHDFQFDYMLGAAFSDGFTGNHGITTMLENGFFFPCPIEKNKVVISYLSKIDGDIVIGHTHTYVKENSPERFGLGSLIEEGIVAWGVTHPSVREIKLPKRGVDI